MTQVWTPQVGERVRLVRLQEGDPYHPEEEWEGNEVLFAHLGKILLVVAIDNNGYSCNVCDSRHYPGPIVSFDCRCTYCTEESLWGIWALPHQLSPADWQAPREGRVF